MGTKVRKMIINRPKFKEITYEDMLLDVVGKEVKRASGYDVVEPKMDGIWGAMHIKHGKYQIWSRTGKLKKEGRADDSGQEMCILGEFMHGSHWGKKNNIDGKFYAFDMVQCNGDWGFSDEPLKNRRKRLNNYWEMGGYFPEFVLINEQWNIESWNEMWQARVEKQGFEGVILKDLDETYMDATWCKIKARADIDYVCMGFGDGHEGTKYENTVGSIYGGLYQYDDKAGYDKLVDVCHVGGLSEVQRDFFNKHRDYFKGKVFTAHGYQIFESGAIRHGKFKSFRTDKEPTDCGFSQVPIHSRGKTH